LYQDKVFLATYDAAVVALEARTGKLLWRAVKADYRQGYTHTAGPFIAGGVVVSGINGCERYKKSGCFITGHDPITGKELWRTSTIALPGDPNDASWAGQPVELRGGGDNWITGSYDPQLNLYYFGTAQAKPWVAASRGMTAADAALYTNSTLALDPRTGKLQWHFQHVPGETLDMETGFERVLVDIGSDKFVLTAGKDGLLWKLDRRNGKFVAVTETLYQNVFKSIDHNTGRVEYRDDIMTAGVDDQVSVCPSIYGGHNWQASAYDPPSNLLLLPLHQLCVDMTGRAVERKEGGGGYGGESTVHPMPGTDGMLGRLSAIDVTTLKPRWSHTQRAMFMTSALTTGGGLAFIGDLDRYFKAFDVKTGEVVWQTRLGSAPHGYPVTYAVSGKQYIAVTTGMGVFKLVTAQQSPDIFQPSGGNMVYVFELAN
jgi:alcohol dehydrogenase (cytochrome c)